MKVRLLTVLLFAVFFGRCQNNQPLFKLPPPGNTNITFNNNLFENDRLNIQNPANIYNDRGLGIGHFKNDGLVDIYFTRYMVSNKVYLNQSSMKFEEWTNIACIGGEDIWCTGISVDFNADGWIDIYVSASFRKDPLHLTNLLYINQGIDINRIPVTIVNTYEVFGLLLLQKLILSFYSMEF